MYLADRLSRVVAFLRVGYPAGMPVTGYVPLVALLPRRVTEDEIVTLTSELIARRRWPISNADVGFQSPLKLYTEDGFTVPRSARRVDGSIVAPLFTCPNALSGAGSCPVVRE